MRRINSIPARMFAAFPKRLKPSIALQGC
jgi:hypothetical protein